MSKREMTDSLERPGLLKELKIILVGPAKCGKTALIQRFVNDTFSDNYVPTGFEKYSTKGKLGDYTIEYSIWDTSGSGSYDTVRPLAYQDAQIFILCFSITDPDSLSLTIAKWLTEIRSHCPTTPIILCGCKGDARRQSNSPNYPDDTISVYQSVITREQALIACQQISGVGYVETCARYQNPDITEIFELAAQTGLGISASPTIHQTSKTTTKKRKTYSISTSTLGKSTSTSGGTMTSCLGNNNKPQIKSDIRKSAKNCEIM